MEVTRRTALGMLALTAAAGTLPLAIARSRHEVLSVYMDLPYIDTTGTATPYDPAAQCVASHAQLSEEAMRSHHCFM
jgi:hypothetical protein